MARTRSRAIPVSLLSLCLSLAASGPLLAQSVTIEFTNTDMPPIKLLDGTSVGIDGEGNLTAQCVLDGTVCEGVSTGPAGNVPAITLTRTGTGAVPANGTLTLNWGVQNGAQVCVATSSPAVAGWNNNLVNAAGGSVNLTMGAAGNYTMSLKCYNQYGVSDTANVAVTVEGGGGPITQIPACTDAAAVATGRVQPAGFTGHLVPWSSLFFGAQFPHGASHLSPIGAFSLRSLSPSTKGPAMNGRYITSEFIAGQNASYQLSWVNPQPVFVSGVIDYGPARQAENGGIFVAVSPCAGDLRAPTSANKNCVAQIRSGSLKFGTTGATGQCPLTAGQRYFLTIAVVDTKVPGDLSTTTTTCAVSAGHRCEANFNAN